MQSCFVKLYSRIFFIIGLHQYIYYGTSMGTIFTSYETLFIVLGEPNLLWGGGGQRVMVLKE